ncbi:hypothetical protein RUND412_002497 [Rhizina undulata]
MSSNWKFVSLRPNTRSSRALAGQPLQEDDDIPWSCFLDEEVLIGDAHNPNPTEARFIHYPYIKIYAGPKNNEEIWFLNTKKFSEKSIIGKKLCLNLSENPHRRRRYRLDLPETDPECAVNMIEFVNNGDYRAFNNSFRMCLRCQLALYRLSLRFGIQGLALMVLRVVGSMLAEAHPEHLTRPAFGNIVKLFHKSVPPVDAMRDLLIGFLTWYKNNGRGRIQYRLMRNHGLNALEGFKIVCDNILNSLDLEELSGERLALNSFYYRADAPWDVTKCWKASVVEKDGLFASWAKYWDARREEEKRGGNILDDDSGIPVPGLRSEIYRQLKEEDDRFENVDWENASAGYFN